MGLVAQGSDPFALQNARHVERDIHAKVWCGQRLSLAETLCGQRESAMHIVHSKFESHGDYHRIYDMNAHLRQKRCYIIWTQCGLYSVKLQCGFHTLSDATKRFE